MKTVYLLLTRSRSWISRIIYCLTGDEYTHISVSVDPALTEFYSFARRHPRIPVPAGFVRETLDGGYYGRNDQIPCALYALDVEDDAYDRMLLRLADMRRHAGRYRYSIAGLLMCRFHRAWDRRRHFFCSQFVGDLLERNGATRLPLPPSLMRPADFARLPGMNLVYEGCIRGASFALPPKGAIL